MSEEKDRKDLSRLSKELRAAFRNIDKHTGFSSRDDRYLRTNFARLVEVYRNIKERFPDKKFVSNLYKTRTINQARTKWMDNKTLSELESITLSDDKTFFNTMDIFKAVKSGGGVRGKVTEAGEGAGLDEEDEVPIVAETTEEVPIIPPLLDPVGAPPVVPVPPIPPIPPIPPVVPVVPIPPVVPVVPVVPIPPVVPVVPPPPPPVPPPPVPPVPPVVPIVPPVVADPIRNKIEESDIKDDGIPEGKSIPENRLGTDFKTIKELIDDINYFFKNFGSVLKNEIELYKRVNKKNINQLIDVHKRIVAIVYNPEQSKKKVGILIDADEYIDSRIRQILLTDEFRRIEARIEPVEPDEDAPKKDFGSFEIKRSSSGKLAIRREPVYKFIPSSGNNPKPTQLRKISNIFNSNTIKPPYKSFIDTQRDYPKPFIINLGSTESSVEYLY